MIQMKTVKLILPLPPVVSSFYGVRKKGKSKYITNKGLDFQYRVLILINKFKHDLMIEAPIDWTANFYLKYDRDIDNSYKALFDTLKLAEVFKDDIQIYKRGDSKNYDPKDPRVEIVIKYNPDLIYNLKGLPHNEDVLLNLPE